MNSLKRLGPIALALGIGITTSLAATSIAASAQAAESTNSPVIVNIGGQNVTFDQPPVEQAGRLYVPLRGMFEKLGASVVYANGIINATSGTHQISLKIGANTATVDGATENLDSPPFVIGGRTLVPLRFVSQALGATVNFDQAQQTVYVLSPEGSRGPRTAGQINAPLAPTPPPIAETGSEIAPIAVQLLRLEPARDTTVHSKRPELAATFGEDVDPNSVHVTLDDRDVTPQTYVSARSFVYDPGSDLPDAAHTVVITGRTPQHEPFKEQWSFLSSGAEENYINGLEPPNGTPARAGFLVSGYTRARSHVKVICTTSENIANFSEVANGSLTAEGDADSTGYFAVRITLPSPAQSLVDVRITSTAPDASVAVKTLRLAH